MQPDYRPRVLDPELEARLASSPAILIEGPKACGKTETARQRAASEVLLDVDQSAQQAADLDPFLVLDGEVPRLIDEWQIKPGIWDAVRRLADDRGQPGQFILTGSAVPPDDETRHSGAGRFARLEMRPMSLFELDRANGSISLRSLLEGESVKCPDPGLVLNDLLEEVVRGGWPGFRGLDVDDAAREVRAYLDEIRRVDIRRVDGVRRNPAKVELVLRALARNVSTHVAIRTITADAGGAGQTLKPHTAGEYLEALERLKIVENQPAWAPHLRSKAILRSAPKRLFVDPSLAAAALRASPDRLSQDLNLFGFMFESLVVRDLRIHAQPLDATVRQYRDSNGLEVDAIVESTSGEWAAFEIKLGAKEQVEEAAENLLDFASEVDTTKCGEPAALGVIVGTGYGYTRKDGVRVIPIGALGP